MRILWHDFLSASNAARTCRRDEVVITDCGIPVARLLGLTATATLERLAADGIIARPTAPSRPRASGQPRPRPRRPVADQVSDQRR